MQKLFGTDGIRGKVGEYPLTEDMIYKIGKAVAVYIKQLNPHKRQSQRISIAKDTRTSGEMFETQLIKGITSSGVDVIKLGVLPTPCSAYLVKKLNYDMGIVISASHNDIDDNGIKFFTHKGYKLSLEEEIEIQQRVLAQEEEQTQDIAEEVLEGTVKDEPGAVTSYIKLLKDIISSANISEYKIAADCAYGAISQLLPKASESLGLNITCINNQPNGENINKECGSLHPEVISEYVIANNLDCGFAFDGDGDRVIMCDEKGKVLDGDFILSIIAKYLFFNQRLTKDTIVATQMSNLGLEVALNPLGIKIVKTDVGDKYVLDRLLKSKLNVGGEQSGHIILLDYTTTGDGLITALFILTIMAKEKKSLSALAKSMYKFPQVLLNIEVDKKRPLDSLPKTAKLTEKYRKKLGASGRLYIRYSGTENKLRVMVEGQSSTEINDIAQEIANTAKEELNA